MSEILPVVDSVKDNIKDGLDHELVMDLNYLQRCYQESLRIEPPVTSTLAQTQTEDCLINDG